MIDIGMMKEDLKNKLPESYIDKINCTYGKLDSLEKIIPNEEDTKYEAKFFSILSDPTRLKIVKLLLQEEVCACIISDLLRLDQTLVSHHLTKLKYLDLIDERRDGKWIFYKVKDEFIAFLHRMFDDILKIKK